MDNISLSKGMLNKSNRLLPEQTVNKITFHGRTGDYFIIWLKNIILCILTLGIYLPWAIVNRRRYFMNATEINHARFEFHAKPTDILPGFVLTGLGLIVFCVLSPESLTLSLLLMTVIILLIPYMLIRLWHFNVRNTSYQGCHFSYRCDYLRLYWVTMILPVLLLIAVVIISNVSTQLYIESSTGTNVDNVFRLLMVMCIVPFTGLFLIWTIQGKQLSELLINNLSYDKAAFSVRLVYKRLMQISLVAVLILLPFMLAGLSQFEGVMIAMVIPPQLWPDEIRIMVMTRIALIYLLIFCGALMAGIYFRVACGKYVVNAMMLGNLCFRCDVTFLSYLWLILTNILLVLFTLGLGSAYADIRHTRYMAQHIRIVGDMNNIFGGHNGEGQADRRQYESVIVSAD